MENNQPIKSPIQSSLTTNNNNNNNTDVEPGYPSNDETKNNNNNNNTRTRSSIGTTRVSFFIDNKVVTNEDPAHMQPRLSPFSSNGSGSSSNNNNSNYNNRTDSTFSDLNMNFQSSIIDSAFFEELRSKSCDLQKGYLF